MAAGDKTVGATPITSGRGRLSDELPRVAASLVDGGRRRRTGLERDHMEFDWRTFVAGTVGLAAGTLAGLLLETEATPDRRRGRSSGDPHLDLDRLGWSSLQYYLHETNPDNGLVRDKTDPAAPCSIAAESLPRRGEPGRHLQNSPAASGTTSGPRPCPPSASRARCGGPPGASGAA